MLHFPDLNDDILNMNSSEKREFLRDVDLTTVNFEIKIADFGFSKRLKYKSQVNRTICGTPLYMAPQVVEYNAYSYKADIWSLGVILFELLNGQTPFHASSRPEFEKKVRACQFTLRDHTIDNLTVESVLFLGNCLRHNEDDRKCISELISHPYITTRFEDQVKIS